MVVDQSTPILELVIKENLKILQERLRNVLSIADYLFERGYFSRADYHEIDDVENAAQRCNKFLEILVSKHQETLLDTFIEHLGQLGDMKGSKADPPQTDVTILIANNAKFLHDKLAISREKFSPKAVKNVDIKLESPAVTDYADFTLTQKCLEEICKEKILKNSKAKMEWKKVISNMSGLEDIELLVYNDEENQVYGDNDMKMRLRFKGEHQTIQNYIHCINWEEIAQKCFELWKERNGTNATFFSLVGIFQHSQLISVADWLLDNKDDIQKGGFRCKR